ncbi:hypothetical protein BC629DRAFT_1057228 [Irpex lacteus]|nr:hypothetical protein BC629DRAFT_1057228 [Irpex lacteus]
MSLQDERPRFEPTTIHGNDIGSDDADGQNAAAAGPVVHRRGRRDPKSLLIWEQKFPEDTRLVFDNRARVAINSQSRVIKSFLMTAISEFKADMAFARPTAKVEERSSRQYEILLRCAKSLKSTHISSRLKKDDAYVRDLAAVPEHRLTIMRGDIKKSLMTSVKEHYRLKPGPDCEKRVKKLKEDLQYIYPGDIMNNLQFSEPFDIPIIHSVLADQFFDGSKSLAARNRTLFKSSDPSKPAETEVPEGMLILVLITIYHCLDEWSTGVLNTRDFQLSAVEKEYKKIIGFVAELKHDHLTMYHRVMHQVFTKTCAIQDVDLATEESLHASALSKVVFDP